MHFAALLYLLLLLPWAAAAVWMLWGRRASADVPFVALWRGPVGGAPVRRAVRVPPVAVLLALLAGLLAILAAAGPAQPFYIPGNGPPLTVVVDRGLTLSATGRLEATAEDAAPSVLRAFDFGPTTFIAVPGGAAQPGNRSEWQPIITSFPPTAVDTRAELSATVARALATTRGHVLVLSDQVLDVPPSDRLVQITPDDAPRDAGVAHLAARPAPRPQVMVRLRRTPSVPADVSITVTSGDVVATRQVRFADAATEAVSFVDVPRLAETVETSIDAAGDDDVAANDRAWLVRVAAWPAIEPRVPLSRELERMIASYRANRPASDGARTVVVAGPGNAPPASTPATIVADATAADGLERPAASLHAAVSVTDHPVTRHVDWRAVVAGARLAGAPAGWTPVIEADGRAVVAVREGAARQAWVGVASEAFPRSADFVVFWTNVFDWVGGGGDAYAAETVTAAPPGPAGWERVAGGEPPAVGVPPGMWPGLYRRHNGTLLAVNAPDVIVGPPPDTGWRDRLEAMARGSRESLRFGPFAAAAALASLVLAAVAWPGSNRRFTKEAARSRRRLAPVET